MMDPVFAYLPSPSSGVLHIGPVALRAYGLLIALGVFAAVWWASRRWEARGGDPGDISAIALWAVPAGLIGARIYHVITDYELYRGKHWVDMFKIWAGGLGIWGGIAAGVLVGAYVAHRRHLDVLQLLDVVAPVLPLAQAIGRWGNYFNQELFGRPTTLPWGLRIDAAHRPPQYAASSTFHPTFLYESLWDLAVVGIVLLVERRVRLKPGRLLAVYVAAYTFGRFFTEWLRIDFAHKFLGLRLNDWTSILVFVVAMVFVITGIDRSPPDGMGQPAEAGEPAEASGASEPAGLAIEEPDGTTQSSAAT
jgi:prolipoprotein diacylglyceryl transferase